MSHHKALSTGRATGPTAGRTGGPTVEAAGLTVVYGRVAALCDVDLTLAVGETVAVMGPNGAGKSTLLRCLVGAVRPTAGHVGWLGDPLTPGSIVRRQIGFIGQEPGLYAELTALENLLFAGRMYGVADVHDRVAAMLADGGLACQADRPVGQLSQGMRQRVAIIRALLHEPRLLVLDEPSANLDAEGREWLERLLGRWRSAGRTVCFATHDAVQSHTLADRIVYLLEGRIVAIEPSDCRGTTLRRSA